MKKKGAIVGMGLIAALIIGGGVLAHMYVPIVRFLTRRIDGRYTEAKNGA